MTDYTDLIARLQNRGMNDAARGLNDWEIADAIAALQAERDEAIEGVTNNNDWFGCCMDVWGWLIFQPDMPDIELKEGGAAECAENYKTAITALIDARVAALQAEVARLRELPQPTVALSERPLFSHVVTPIVAHDDGSQTILDQSGNGRHWHIPAKE